MALARVKVWIEEALNFADLNAEFDNIINNPGSLISGATVAVGLTETTPGTVPRRASVYHYTAWDPSDVAGTQTNAPATAVATSTAVDYVTAANSSGTVTFTCVKAGQYRITITVANEIAAAVTAFSALATVGGTATFLVGTPTSINLTPSLPTSAFFESVTFYVTMTAAQTVTILPKVAVTSGGVTTNFTHQCTVSAEYTGT